MRAQRSDRFDDSLRLPGRRKLRAWPVTLAVLAVAGAAAAEQLAESPPAAVSAYSSAAAMQNRGLTDLAIDAWRALLIEHPGDPLAARARHNLGVCLFEAGDYQAAAEAFAKSAEAAHADGLAARALLHLGLAEFKLAEAAGEKPPAGEQRGADDAAAMGKGTPLSGPPLKRALAAFESITQQHPGSDAASAACLYAGECYARLGRHERAISTLRAGLAQHAGSRHAAAMRLALAASLLETGAAAAAEQAADRLLAEAGLEKSTRAEGHRLRGDARRERGRFGEAAADYARAAATPAMPWAASARMQQAYALYRAGDHDGALAAYDSLAEAWPGSPLVPEAALAAGKCLMAAGRYGEAGQRFGRLWSANPVAANSEAAHWQARAALRSGGGLTAAVDAVEAALATEPGRPWEHELMLDRGDLSAKTAAGQQAAAQAYLTVLQAAPGTPAGQRAAAQAAHTLLGLGEPAEALRLAEQALRRGVDDRFRPALLQVAAEASGRSGDSAEAARLFAQLVAEFPDDQRRGEWLYRQAHALAAEDHWDDVVRLLAPALPRMGEGPFPRAAALLADGQHKTGDVEASIRTLSGLIERWTPRAERGPTPGGLEDPVLPRALYDRGVRRWELGDADAAAADFTRLIEQFTNHETSPFARLALGQILFAAGDFERCVRTLQGLSSRDGEVAGRARYRLAAAYHEQGRHGQALESLEGARAPQAELDYLRGVVLAALGRRAEAAGAFRASLEAAGGEAGVADRALYELAWLEQSAGRIDAAVELFDRLATEHTDSPLAAEALLRAGEARYRAGDRAAAAEQLRAAADLAGEEETQERARHMLGWALLDGGDPIAAERAFEAQLRGSTDGPLAADARLMIAECRFKRDAHSAAVEAYEQAFRDGVVRPQLRPLGRLHQGQALSQLGRWEEAVAVLRPLAEGSDSPQAEPARYELAWALQKLGKTASSMALLRRVAADADSLLAARAAFVLGELQFAQQQHEEAVRTFFKVAYGYGGDQAPVAYHTWQSQALFEAARCLEALGRRDPAIKLYREVVTRFPDSEKARFARDRLQRLARR